MDTKAGVGAVRGPLGARFGIVGAIARQRAYARKINIPIQVIGGPGKYRCHLGQTHQALPVQSA